MGIRRRSNRGLLGTALVAFLVLATSCGSNPVTPATRSADTAAPSTVRHAPNPAQQTRQATATRSGGGRLAAPVEPSAQRLQISHATLTTENWATYNYSTGAVTTTASALADLIDANVREVFWRSDGAPAADQQSCITWDETAESVEGEPIQPGLAMRIASVGANNQGIKAVTLTENVVFAGTWFFNVHVWDTLNPKPMTLVKTIDVSRVVGQIANVDGRTANFMVQPPWHLCGQTEGNTFRFKVWTQDNPEPSWNDPNRVFTVALPPGWDYSGFAGGYIGHLHPGQSATATAELATPID